MEGSSRLTKIFCTVLVSRIQCMASRSSPQDILTLFGIQCLCLHNLPILICPHPKCSSDSRRVHLNRFRYANARNQRDLTSPELHQHSYKSFCEIDYCRIFANILQYDTKGQSREWYLITWHYLQYNDIIIGKKINDFCKSYY